MNESIVTQDTPEEHDDKRLELEAKELELEAGLQELEVKRHNLETKERLLETSVEVKRRELDAQRVELEASFHNSINELTAKESALYTRELAVAELERSITAREFSIAQKETALQDELNAKRADFQVELSKERASQLESLANEKKKHFDLAFAQRQAQLEELQQKLNQREQEIQETLKEIERAKAQVKNDRDRLVARSNKIESEISARAEEEANRRTAKIIQIKDSELQARQSAVDYANSVAMEQTKLADEANALLNDIRVTFSGSEPSEILQAAKMLKERVKTLEERMGSIIQSNPRDYERLKEELSTATVKLQTYEERVKELSHENTRLSQEVDITRELENKNHLLSNDLERERRVVVELNIDMEKLNKELARLKGNYGTTPENARIAAIERPNVENAASLPRKQMIADRKPIIREQEWLDGISKGIKEAGFTFSPRILKSFHTSLKTAEYSPITVLAGVSGVGKSALPKMYARLGGINFLMEPVLPDWDSPQSMLGFFDVINDTYKAEPILNLLAQSALTPSKADAERYNESYHADGLRDTMTMILLDEMNLAHVELYFAPFLSKLEERRGEPPDFIPKISVDLGSGFTPYQLRLGRNVLWVGSMNQDETTKALSDKVLDRGTVITFPRPKRLMDSLDVSVQAKKKAQNAAPPLLTSREWMSWQVTAPADGMLLKCVSTYKKAVEDINESLGRAGRSIGHRVWQTIEAYIKNYPDVILAAYEIGEHQDGVVPVQMDAAVKIAFEDCVAQKIAPKLRGIPTRGGNATLDEIYSIIGRLGLPMVEDFQRAMKSGNTFNWVSSNYLSVDDDDSDDSDSVRGDENAVTQ